MKCFTCMAASASCSIPPLLHFIKTLHTHKTPRQHSLLIRHHLPLLSSTKLKPCCNHLQAFLTMTKLRLAFPQFKHSTAVHPGYLKEIERARRELRALISIEKCAPLMLRLAWHDAGTYEPETKTGGPNGSIRTAEELDRYENKGLQKAVEFCEEVKVKCPKISYADLYQLAGVVAVEVTGGPTIDFVPGRQDSLEPSPAGRLPDANKGAKHLREVFYRMGLTDREIVALSGGHTLGQAHRDRSGFEFRWTKTPLKFDNSYFVELLKSKGETMLPTDKALVEDSLFIKYVELYSQDEEAFFTDYAAAHKKLSELGYNLKPVGEHRIAHGVIGIFIASTMVILGYLFEVNRRSK